MPAPAQLPPLKRGDTFSVFADYDEDGAPMVFDASQLRSQIRTLAGALVANLTIAAVAGTPGRFEISSADTSAWPVGEVLFDIRRTDAGEVRSTSTVILPIVPRNTV